MERLEADDFRTLVQIEKIGLKKNSKILPQFPGVKKKQIERSVDKLKNLGMIFLDKDAWSVTYEGEQYMQANSASLENYISEFGDNLVAQAA